MGLGQVHFDDTVQVTISTGCITTGGQGYLGRLNFGSSDHPASGEQTSTEYDWACAAIASNAAGEDTVQHNLKVILNFGQRIAVLL